MFAPRSNRNRETAATIPDRSGQAINSRPRSALAPEARPGDAFMHYPTRARRERSRHGPEAFLKAAVLGIQPQRYRVDAIPLAGGSGAVVEHVAQVPAAMPARHFCSAHPVAAILAQLDVCHVHRFGEAGPAGSGVEFGAGAKKLAAAARAQVRSVLLGVHVLPRERWFSSPFAEHGVLLGSEGGAPLLVGFLDLRIHASLYHPVRRIPVSSIAGAANRSDLFRFASLLEGPYKSGRRAFSSRWEREHDRGSSRYESAWARIDPQT